jgi:predicted DNA binding CopG/RHH family protein
MEWRKYIYSDFKIMMGKPVKNIKQEKEKSIVAARNTLKKDKRTNLRLS